jgi:transcriptional regulator with PAS, ATPase and Fis domain
VDVRVIAATNRSLAGLVAEGRFRSDLYYRLNVIPLVVPPLRARRGDIPKLAFFFLERFARKMGRPVKGIESATLERLCAYDYPGNVRELENLIERAVVLSRGPILTLEPGLLGASSPEPASKKSRARRTTPVKAGGSQ